MNKINVGRVIGALAGAWLYKEEPPPRFDSTR